MRGQLRPLPAHFGEIDITAAFDPHRYFTMLRCSGSVHYLWRYREQGVQHCMQFYEPGMLHGPSELHKRRFYEAVAWSNTQDKDHAIVNQFFKEIVLLKPDGDFIHHLGC